MGNEREVESIKELVASSGTAIKAGDLESFMALWDVDGVVMWPGQPVMVGKEAVYSWFSENIFGQLEYLEISRSLPEVKVADGWAYVWLATKGVVRSQTNDQTYEFTTKAIEILRQQADGSWKFWRTIHNQP